MTQKRYPDTDRLRFSRLAFYATKLCRLMVTPGLRKRAAHQKSNGVRLGVWSRGGGDEAGPQRERKRCRWVRLFSTVHINSTSFAACRFKDRDPTNVLRAGRASGAISASFDRTFRRCLFRGTELTRPLVPDQLHPRPRRDRH